MKKSSNTSYKNSGFTLIEVIIAMSLLSLILILLFSTIFTTNKHWHLTEKKITQNEELRLVSFFIQKQLSQNIPLMWLNKTEQKLIFEGKSNELRFTSTLPAHRGGGGIKILLLKTNLSEDQNHLDLYYQQANPDVSPFDTTNKPEQVTLLDNVKRIELSYYGQEEINEEPVWKDEWQNDTFLPLLISLKIFTTDNNDWPEIKIPLHSSFIKGQPQFILRQSPNLPI